MELTSFLLYGDQLEQIQTLTMQQRGLLLTALMEAACGDMPRQGEMDPVVYVAFSFIWAQVQRDKKKYAETSARREEAGRKGGIASGDIRRQQAEANGSKQKPGEANRSKPKQNEANGSKVKQTEAEESKPKQIEANESSAKQTKQTESDSESDSDSIKKESKKKKAAAPAAASGLLPPLDDAQAERLNAAFRSFAEMRKKIRAPLTEDAARLIVETLKKLATIDGRFDVDLAVKIMNQSTERSWRGIFPLKDDAAAAASPAPAAVHKPNAFHNFDQRQNDYGAIMQAARERERMEQAARSG